MDRGQVSTSTLAERDAEVLLAEFSCADDERAFGEIVRRYASMVFSVCLRVCANAHDAEDATQAAFLTLAVQCKSGKPVKRLGPWLRQVATRAALDVRRARKRRETHEQRHVGQRMHEVAQIHREQGRNGTPVGTASAVAPYSGSTSPTSSTLDLEKLSRVMGEELNRLPPKYRLPLVCLYFSGMSRPDVAKELGCTLGTLGVRVHRGRQMLAKRLADRGMAPPNGLLSASLLATAAASAVKGALLGRAASAAARAALGHDLALAVTENVLAALKATGAGALFAKLKGVAVIALLIGVTAVAAGGATRDWHGVGTGLPEVMRTIARWITPPKGWRVPLPSFRGPAGVTPLAASHAPARQESAKPRAANSVEDSTWTVLLQQPGRGAPVLFAADQPGTPQQPTSLLDRHDDGPAVILPLFRTDSARLDWVDRPSAWPRGSQAPLEPQARAELPWQTLGYSPAGPSTTPEPSAAGIALVCGGAALLRRRRR